MKSMGALSIQKKLTLLFGMALLLSLSAVAGLAVYQASSVAEKRLVEQELPSMLGRIAVTVDQKIMDTLSAGRSIAQNTLLAREVERGIAEPELLLEQLRQVKTSQGADMAFLVAASGQYFTDQGFLKTVSPDRPRDQWFYNFLNSGKDYELALDVDESSGKMMAFVNYRMQRGQRSLAVAGVGVNLTSVAELVNSYRIGDTGVVFLVNQDGLIKVHPDAALVNKATLHDLQGVSQLAGKLLAHGDFTVQDSELAGNGQFLASSYIPSLGWFLVASVPKAAVLAELERTFQQVLLFVLCLSLLLLLPVFWISRSVSSPIRHVAGLLREIGEGEGDLRSRLEVKERNELGQLAEGFNGFVGKIQGSIREVDSVTRQVEVTLREVTEGAESTIQDVNTQQQRVLQMASSIEQMRASIQEIARGAEEASQTSTAVLEQATTGVGLLTDASQSIDCLAQTIGNANAVIRQLDQDIQGISNLLVVIREVSDNTNLLALNASIEAARAGEQGRGFAVVADEVRGLAMKSNQLTNQIQQIINQLQQGASNAMEAMEQALKNTTASVQLAGGAGEAFETIRVEINTISEKNDLMAENLSQQSLAVEEVADSANQISDAGDRTVAAAGQSSAACRSLRDSVERLTATMSQFRY
ncbi:methyl-accepting chemotaxis protein [Marinobacterium arenosum]|uniref:methyl-accepting chemotaxis protein n=1 Tax=Marinobacterium arenosum TaxID=2862496 RepID=UPI001C97B314|nr:methyl-accepting chemotaxis protein [Marinobacterium arenosum]MBY4678158.1 methyl-accepting chemotaxis protein [Marinobacterium arenosum]